MNKVFTELGMNNSEIKVYNGLLNLGSSNLARLQEFTGIERRYLYDILRKLIEKGFVTYQTEKRTKKYLPVNPKRFLSYIDERKDELNKKREKINDALPKLLELYEDKKPEHAIETLIGREGVKVIGELVLEHKETYFIGGNASIREFMPGYWEFFNKKRIENKIKWHDLRIEGTNLEEDSNFPFYESRILPKEMNSPQVITIFGDYVALTLWSEIPTTILIRNEKLVESYLKYFHFLWGICKKK